MAEMTKHSGKASEVAWCSDCEWANENRKNALATGARHAQATGHEVRCEQAVVVIYNKRDA